MTSVAQSMMVRPGLRGCVIGLGLGKKRFVGSGVGLLMAACLAMPAMAGPEGAKVAAGQASIVQRGNRTVIRAADKTIIDYSRFDLNRNESVRFVQPSSSAMVLNRINSATPTNIDGAVRSNGIVYFANRAGVVFGKNATFNVGGLYAAAGNISNEDFMAGRNRFTDVTGSVVNQGKIDAGFAALVGQQVANSGVITSRSGTVAMVAGNEVILTEQGGNISVKVDAEALGMTPVGATPDATKPGVENTGRIEAKRGNALLVAGDMYSLAVKNSGTIKAQNINIEGRGSGKVEVSGRLNTRNMKGTAGTGPRLTGGDVTITGETVNVTNARIDASGAAGGGKVRIGGDYQGTGTLRQASTTSVDSKTTISADANIIGDGGTIIVWSTDRTNFYGTATVRGGLFKGDGGLVETSGKITLDVKNATVRAGSRSGGANGLWLLDPVNVTIAASPGSGTTTTPTPGTDTINPDNSVSPAIVDVTSVISALENGTNVTITTGSVGADAGNISVDAPIALSNAPGGTPDNAVPTLTLQAANNIDVNQAITTGGAALPLNVTLQAGNAIDVGANITTGGGNFVAAGSNFVNSGAITTAGGNVAINATGNINVQAAINASGGAGNGGVRFTSATLDATGGSTQGIDAAVTSGLGGIQLRTSNANASINVAQAGAGYNVSQAELLNLSAPSGATVEIGTPGGTGNIGFGAMNLGASTSNYTFQGGQLTLNAGITGGNNAILSLVGSTLVDNNGIGTDIAVGGNGGVQFDIDGAVGSIGSPLQLSVAAIGPSTIGGNFFADNDNSLAVGALTVGGNMRLRASGTLSNFGAWTITGATELWTRDDAGEAMAIVTPGSTFGGPVTLRSRQLTNDTLLSNGSIDFVGSGIGGAALVLGDVENNANGIVSIRSGTGISQAAATRLTFGTGNLFLTAGGPIVLDRVEANGSIRVDTSGATANTGGVSITTLNTSSTGIDLISGSVALGRLSLTAGTGNISLPTMSVGGGASLTTLGNNATITTGLITATAAPASTTPNSFDLTTTGAGSTAQLSVDGPAIINADVPGTLQLSTVGDMSVLSGIGLRIVSATATGGAATFEAPDMEITGAITADSINLIPDTDARTVGLGGGTGDFNIDASELAFLSASEVLIGRSSGTGAVNLGSSGSPVDLSLAGYSLTLRGGPLTFNSGLTLAAGERLTLRTSGVTGQTGMSGPDVTIGAGGELLIDTSGDVDLDTDVDVLAANVLNGTLNIDNARGLTIGSIGGVDGVTTTGGAGVTIAADGLLSINEAVTTASANAVNLSSTNSIGFVGDGSVTGGAVGLTAAFNIFGNAGSATRVTGASISLIASGGGVGVGAPLRTATGGALVLTGPAGVDVINTGDAQATITTGGLARVANTGVLTFAGASTAGTYDVTTTGGGIVMNANVGATGSGASSFTSAGGFDVTASNTLTSVGDVSITAENLTLDGSINTGSGRLAIGRFTAGTIAVGDAAADMVVSKAELGRITTALLTLGNANTTTITASNVEASDLTNIGFMNLWALASGGDVVFSGTQSTFRGLSVLADDNITLSVNVSLASGGLGLTANANGTAGSMGGQISFGPGVTLSTLSPNANDITLSARQIVGTGGFTVASNRDLTVNTTGGLDAGGNLTMSAKGAFTINSDVAGQNITLRGDDGIALNGNLTSTPVTGATTGSPTIINADNDADGTGLFSLASGKAINTNDATLTLTAGDVQLDGTIDTGVSILTIARGGAGTIGLGNAAGDMTISGAELQNITADDLVIGGATTTLVTADGVSGTDTANIADSITLIADDMEFAGAFNSGAADLTLSRGTEGFISLGNATGGLNLTNAELANITAPTLTIGGGMTGNIIANGVAGASTANVAGLVTLDAGGVVRFTGAPSEFKTLTVNADDGITISQNLTTTVGDLFLDGDNDNAIDSQDSVSISFNRVVTSAGKLTIKATTGGGVGTSGATLNANTGIDLLDGFAASGTVVMNSDLNADGTGTLLVSSGKSITTSSNGLSLTVADLTLDGSIDAGTGSVTIRRAASGSIGLGLGAGDLTISGVELQRITATGLDIGGSNIGNINVSGVTATNSNGIAGVTTLTNGSTGAITFDGANTFNALTARAGATLTVNNTLTTDAGGLILGSNTGGGSAATNVITLKNNITAPNTQDVTFESPVILGGNVTVAGNDVTFTGSVNSDSTLRSLTVNTATNGLTRFNGVGQTSRLFTLTTNADGRTLVNGNVSTSGSMTFLDDVRLMSDVVFNSGGGLGITFGQNVNSAGGGPARSLTAITRRNTSSTVKRIPLISFGGRVGGRRALSNIYLNFDPANPNVFREDVPAVATIVARPLDASGLPIASPTRPLDSLFNTTGEFRMGRNEKLSGLGTVEIRAASAVLGDINAFGNLRVTAPSIVIQLRDPSRVLGSLVSNVNPTGLSVVPDRGVDFVAGGMIDFSTTPTTTGTGAVPSFGSTNGAADMSATLAPFLRQQYGDLIVRDFNRIETSGSTTLTAITLDLISSGPTDAPLATTLAGAIPRESRTSVVGEDQTIAQAQIDELRNLGVFARNPSSDELISLLGGAATYDDVPRKSLPTASDYTTVVNRLPADRVAALLATYDRVFNKAGVDESGNEVRVNRSAEIQASLLESVRRFRAARAASAQGEGSSRAFDPLAFRAYLESTPEEATSLGYIQDLERFLNELEAVGLTPRELAQSKAAILNPVRPRGIPTVQMLEAVIRGQQVSMSK